MNKKFLTFLVVCFSVLGCTVTRLNSQDFRPPTESFLKVLTTIEILSCDKSAKKDCPKGRWTQAGSGMAINLDGKTSVVLSAGHVCDSKPDKKIKQFTQVVNVIDFQGTVHPAWPVHVSQYEPVDTTKSRGDLCILWVPTLDVPKVNFSRNSPKVGDEVIYVGAPLGIHHPPTVPIFKGIFSGNINSAAAIATFPAIGGASGSAVLNRRSQIVGVVFAANPIFHHVSLMTNHKSFLLFLKDARKKLNDIRQ
tara:strand:+ start:466 stop:1218 length:753 start_codon:yes stop_codon:yes gene_type:complete